MKAPALALVIFATAATALAGPASPNQFVAPALRQDLTGQGTYHRLGLIREQDRAVAKRPAPTSARKAPAECWFARAWRSLFSQKASSRP